MNFTNRRNGIRRLLFIIVPVYFLCSVALSDITVNYGTVSLDYNSPGFAAADTFDLVVGDVELSFTINTGGVSGDWTYYAKVGLTSSAMYEGNFNGPESTYGCIEMLVGDHQDSCEVDTSEKLALKNSNDGEWESLYDAYGPDDVCSPVGLTDGNNPLGRFYNMWFDRGSYQWTSITPRTISGVNVDTNGIYHVKITYHMVDSNTATMFATVNDENQGFYTQAYWDSYVDPCGVVREKPDVNSIGLSFHTDLRNLKVFAGTHSINDAGAATITDLSVKQQDLYLDLNALADFAEAWLCSQGETCFNGRFDYVTDNIINFSDFAVFAKFANNFEGGVADGNILMRYAMDDNGANTTIVGYKNVSLPKSPSMSMSFEDSSYWDQWAVRCTLSYDTVNHSNDVTQALKLTKDVDGTYFQAGENQSPVKDLSSYDYFLFKFYIYEGSGASAWNTVQTIQLFLRDSNDIANQYVIWNSAGKVAVESGWHTVSMPLCSQLSGAASLGNIARMTVYLTCQNTSRAVVSLDKLQFFTETEPAIAMIRFDDDWAAQWTLATYLEQHGMRGSFGCIGSLVDTSGFLTLSQLHDLHNNGHLIVNHSWDSNTTANLTVSQFVQNVRTNAAWLTANGFGDGARILIMPGGYSSAAVEDALSSDIDLFWYITDEADYIRLGTYYNIQRIYGVGGQLLTAAQLDTMRTNAVKYRMIYTPYWHADLTGTFYNAIDDLAADANIKVILPQDLLAGYIYGTAQRNTSLLATAGKVGGAISFNGTSDNVDTHRTFQSNSLTLTCWVKPDDGQPSSSQVIFSRTVNDGNHFEIYLKGNGVFDANCVVQGVSKTVSLYQNGKGVSALADGSSSWVMLTAVLPDCNISGTGNLYMGSSFAGAMDEVRIYDKALSAKEVKQLYRF